MNMRCVMLSVGVLFTTTPPVLAQAQAQLYAEPFRSQPVTSAPFSATQTTTRVQTVADGIHINWPEQKTVMYRDSVGRTRRETAGRGLPDGVTLINIFDPVGGFQYQLNTKTKTGQKTAMPRSSANGPPQRVSGPTSSIATSGKVMSAIRPSAPECFRT